ncbi:hypothetical protein WN943_018923 [Citrus x changshan-huyou]
MRERAAWSSLLLHLGEFALLAALEEHTSYVVTGHY